MEATAPVTVEQAAAILGVSPSTVHRRIRSGTLRAEQAQRPQGTVWLVHLPPDTVAAAADLPPPTGAEATAPTGAISSTPQTDAMVSLIQTTIATVLGPLVVELGVSRQTIERQAEQIAQLREDRGRLTAELERAASTIVALSSVQEARTAPESAPASSEPSVPVWRRLWPLALAVAGFLVVVLLVAWPR